MQPQAVVEGFFDPATSTVSYVVYEAPGKSCAIIDPVLDYDHKSGRTRTVSADKLAAFVRSRNLTVNWILETHVHADHMSAGAYLRKALGGRLAIGAAICEVQQVFKDLYNLEADFRADGSQYDYLFDDNEAFSIGTLPAAAWFVPGHTPACAAYVIGDAVFVGDTLFMPDVGSARCDFPGGDAKALYASVQRLMALPTHTRMFVCHDYPPAGRPVRWETSVSEQLANNIHVRDGVSESEFIAMRTTRDRKLEMPALMLPAIQVNIRGGEVPPPEVNGVSYLKIPLNRF